jgi:CheY-like chemotaxis protein
MTTTLKHFSAEALPAAAPVATILVVDDNPTNLKLASDVLEFAGYRVLKAVDAEQAQVVLCHFQPNLIFMDIALPGMDGLTLTRKLKADPSTQHIRIVALTAFAMKGDDQKACEAGCDGYIAKPIDTRNFPAQAAEFLQGRTNFMTAPLG